LISSDTVFLACRDAGVEDLLLNFSILLVRRLRFVVISHASSFDPPCAVPFFDGDFVEVTDGDGFFVKQGLTKGMVICVLRLEFVEFEVICRNQQVDDLSFGGGEVVVADAMSRRRFSR